MRTQVDVHAARILHELASSSADTMSTSDVLEQLEEVYGDSLNDEDQEENTREAHWKTRAKKAASDLHMRGLIEIVDRGIWRITDAGRTRVEGPKSKSSPRGVSPFIPAVYGVLEGCHPGEYFESRMKAFTGGVHRHTRAGMAGGADGVYSICLSGGYEGDRFLGSIISYTGAGGFDFGTRKFVADQLLQRGNLGLVRNHESGRPVRVIVAANLLQHHSLNSGYVYVGLYEVASWAWTRVDGFRVLQYQLVALPGLGADSDGVLVGGDAPPELDGESYPAQRRAQRRNQIIRDPRIPSKLKRLYDWHCQVCGERVETSAGPYAEGAHIMPLGEPHNGPDRSENMLCLCPNCHKRFDGKAVWVGRDGSLFEGGQRTDKKLKTNPRHKLNMEYLEYHRGMCGVTLEDVSESD